MDLKFVRKRNGTLQEFSQEKIERAIYKALLANHIDDFSLARKLAADVTGTLRQEKGRYPAVEHIQDVVEEALMKSGYPQVARAYILYRERRKELRESKRIIGIEDRLKLSLNAASVLKKRYLLRNEKGQLVETPEEMFKRVASVVSQAEKKFRKSPAEYEERFYNLMANLEFLPNSPALMNAGTVLGQLSACFVLPVPDSIKGIFGSLKDMALIHKSGGGTGFSFSRLRPKGDLVGSTRGIASGPLSFMEIFDKATEVVKQGGRRRGANMAVLRVDHPDIFEFITAKRRNVLTNFNISVAVTDEFMARVRAREQFNLVNPRNRKTVRKVSADELFDIICQCAWETGDPGLIYLDEINRHNPTPSVGAIETTNPCAETPLLPYESCNLGSINLSRTVMDRKIDWGKLKELVQLGVRFLDDMIEVNKYPLPEIERLTRANRKIGLGVMGWADFLAELEIPYGSRQSLKLAEEMMKFINQTAFDYSCILGKERGSFPNFAGSIYRRQTPGLRNATRTTIAPTGTISIIAGCSSGIEPFFALAYVRNILGGSRLLDTNPVFERKAGEKGILDSALLRQVVRTGTLRNLKDVPEKLRKIFPTAFEIPPEIHLKMQAVFQKYTDNAVSKTVNLPAEGMIEDVRDVFLAGHKLKCKGVTVFRYGSKPSQVLYLGEDFSEELDYLELSEEFSGCSKGVCNY